MADSVSDSDSDEEQLRLDKLASGDDQVVDRFWQQYGERLIRLAEKHLCSRLQRRVGPDDIVQSACRTFFRRAKAGQFDLADSDSLWRLLCVITLNKVRSHSRFHTRQKRAIRGELHLDSHDDESHGPGLQAVAPDPSPEEVIEFTEFLEGYLNTLDDDEQRIVQLRLEGRTSEEMADELGCSERTIRRRLQRVRARLNQALAEPDQQA